MQVQNLTFFPIMKMNFLSLMLLCRSNVWIIVWQHECFLPSAPWLALEFQHKQTNNPIDPFYFIHISFNPTKKSQKMWTVSRTFSPLLAKWNVDITKVPDCNMFLTIKCYFWLAEGIVPFISMVASYTEKLLMTSLCKWASGLISNKSLTVSYRQ